MTASDPHLFRSTLPYYERYRAPYPETLIAAVGKLCGVAPGSHVLDLGCGPGQLAIAFARLGAEVTAMDPDRAMLARARERVSEAGMSLRLIEGGSTDLSPEIGRFRLVVMGRSFHWMDRDATLAALERMIEPGGAIAFFGDERIATPDPDWPALVKRLREEFLPERSAARRHRFEREGHAVVLARSAFPQLDLRGVVVTRTLTPDAIVGFVYSHSDTSPEALGARRMAFEAALREGLAQLSPAGVFSESVAVTAVIACRAS